MRAIIYHSIWFIAFLIMLVIDCFLVVEDPSWFFILLAILGGYLAIDRAVTLVDIIKTGRKTGCYVKSGF
jgi:hypothetical protein